MIRPNGISETKYLVAPQLAHDKDDDDFVASILRRGMQR
jgi:hypothetical protein